MNEPVAAAMRALLIGVPTYADDAIDDLPFIVSDLAELEGATRSAGYEVTVHPTSDTDRDSIEWAIESFIADARPEEQLLIYLSGHGIHHKGMDYLIPRGARTRSRDFPSRCMPINFESHIEDSRAGDVLVCVDACREGVDLRTMGDINTTQWSERKELRVLRRKVAYFYACSAGEKARFVTSGATTFSLFSRALSQVIADETVEGTLGAIETAVQNVLDGLAADHQEPRQQVRVHTSADKVAFTVLHRPERREHRPPGQHPWVALAESHPAWRQVADHPTADDVTKAVVSLVGDLSLEWDRHRAALNGDPWLGPDLAERMTAKIRWLLTKVLNPEKLKLSPAEAAVLVVFPFLHQTFWACQAAAAGIDPCTSGSSRFERFASGYGRLLRRCGSATDTGDDASAAAIKWWIFHRWLVRQPSAYRPDSLTGMLGANPHAVFTPERVLEMLRVMQVDAAFLRRADRSTALKPMVTIAPSTDFEQPMREVLLGYLLTAAYRFAIDATALPEVVVDHIGISKGVRPADVHAALAQASWDGQGRTRVLAAKCAHQAIDVALREHAEAVNSLLTEMDQVSGDPHLEPLTDMPTHATADRVGAAVRADGSLAYDEASYRFRLADDQIQELLMGEQLYGEPDLAVRELYQNALDACRYRDARTAFLRAKGAKVPEWSGEIRFEQGTDDNGRPYLDCVDNGIGMGRRELVDVFSRAGVRFADLPEYIEELADWHAEGIELYPNSRFGIGVLSYFMLADEITVTTCRLDRNGRPGEQLEVHIAGPGALFRVRALGQGDAAGTRVRLHLRATPNAVQCVSLLRRILWVSDYDVEATDATDNQTWTAGELSLMAPIGAENPLKSSASRKANKVTKTATGRVWWCDSRGGILADGLWAGAALFGAVVNLTGPDLPRLTVDRKKMLEIPGKRVTAMLTEAIPAVVTATGSPLTPDWLSVLVETRPRLADEIFEHAVDAEYEPWIVGGTEAPIGQVGCFPLDKDLLSSSRRFGLPNSPNEIIMRWRLTAWMNAGKIPVPVDFPDTSVLCARPSDYLLTTIISPDRTMREWAFHGSEASMGQVLRGALKTDRTPAEVAERLAVLGISTPSADLIPTEAESTDIALLSVTFDDRGPWLPDGTEVSWEHVVAAAAKSGLSPRAVRARLTRLGFTTPAADQLPSTVQTGDLTLIRRNDSENDPFGRADWKMLPHDNPIDVRTVVGIACSTGQSPRQVSRRLSALGFHIPPDEDIPEHFDQRDRIIINYALEPGSRRLVSDPVPVPHLVLAALKTGMPVQHVAPRLAQLGWAVPHSEDIPVRLPDCGPGEIGLIQHHLEPSLPAHLGGIVKLALKMGRSPAETARRLRSFGFVCPPEDTLPAQADPLDVVITDRTLGIMSMYGPMERQEEWLLPGDQPVSVLHVVRAAAKVERTPAFVAQRLAELGFSPPDADMLPATWSSADLQLLSREQDGRPPWLPDDVNAASLGQLLAAAAVTGQAPSLTADRFKQLGIDVPSVPLPDRVDRTDLQMVSKFELLHRFGIVEWLRHDVPVAARQVVATAARTGRRTRDVADRLKQLGFQVADVSHLPATANDADPHILALNPRYLDGTDAEDEFPLGHVLYVALNTGLSHAQVISQVQALGLKIV